MSDWAEALDAQLKLIRWWRSDDGLAYGAYIAWPGYGGPEAAACGNFARAFLRLKNLSTEKKLADKWEADLRKYGETAKHGFELAHDLANVLDDSVTYWASPEMGRFLLHAHDDIPVCPLTTVDIPVLVGFVFFSEPLLFEHREDADPVQLRAVSWNLHEKSQTIDITGWCIAEGRVPLHPALMRIWPIGQPPNSSLAKLLQAFWVLSGQRIALASSRPADRHVRKRAERAGFNIPEDGIRVVTLRRPESRRSTGADEQLVDWSHRWIVSGHWRNQWHPSEEMHRPKWIEAYEKGPEDKPLVLKDRVYRWVR